MRKFCSVSGFSMHFASKEGGRGGEELDGGGGIYLYLGKVHFLLRIVSEEGESSEFYAILRHYVKAP